MKIALVFIAFTVAIVLDLKKRINMGLTAGVAALLIGLVLLRIPANAIKAYLPGKVIFTLLPITLFYGFAMGNGTLHALMDGVLYWSKRWRKLLPLFIYLICMGLGILGIGAASIVAIMAPLVISMAYSAHISPLLCSVALAVGATTASNYMFSEGGIISRSIIESTVYAEQALPIACEWFVDSIVVFLVILALYYVLEMRAKQTLGEIAVERPAPFNPVQKKTLILIITIVLCIAIPPLLKAKVPCAFTKRLASVMDVSLIMLSGALLAAVMRLGSLNDCIKNFVPWNSLIRICGCSLLIGVGVEAGLVDVLTAALLNNIPIVLVAPVLAFCSGIMSCFSSTIAVVVPTMFPLVPGIAAATGVDPALLFSAVFVGAGSTGIGPFSTGGSMIVGVCKSDADAVKMTKDLLITAFVSLAIASLYFLIRSLILR